MQEAHWWRLPATGHQRASASFGCASFLSTSYAGRSAGQRVWQTLGPHSRGSGRSPGAHGQRRSQWRFPPSKPEIHRLYWQAVFLAVCLVAGKASRSPVAIEPPPGGCWM